MTGFRGADPVGVESLGAAVEYRAGALTRATNEAFILLESNGRSALADGVGTRLSGVGRLLVGDAHDLINRAALVRMAEVLGGVGAVPAIVSQQAWAQGQFALVAPMGLMDWDGAYRRWRSGPSIEDLAALDPEAVADAFGAMSVHAATRLVLDHPEGIGRLDGAPPNLRYDANRILVMREIERLEDLASALRLEFVDAGESVAPSPVWAVARQRAALAELVEVEGIISRYRLWADEHGRLLLFDPTGDGRVAEVFGDLAEAEHVGVVVPGITNDITNFGPPGGGGFRENGADLYRSAAALDGSVATIAWLGYDTPDGADALADNAADASHGDLVRFIDGLVAEGDRHITVIGHSYGSLVTGMAAGDGIAADEVVFVGSPGTSLDHAGDANLPPGGEVWAGLASWDLIGAGVSVAPDDLWEASLSLPGRYIWDVLTTGDLAAEDLWHGRNPAHESFGAVEFTTDGATGHSQYFDPGTESLENLARIVAGLTPQVTVLASEPMEMAPGPFGEDWEGPASGDDVV
jgi:hypothetical protein